MEPNFILIQGKPDNKLSTGRFSSIGQLHEFLVRKYFRELKEKYGEKSAKQIIKDATNRAIISSF